MNKQAQGKLRKSFSRNLVYWLGKREKSQAELCKQMHVSSATVSDWCNAKKIPRIYNIIEITDWLKIELSDLFTEDK